jgi:hypothetical protein
MSSTGTDRQRGTGFVEVWRCCLGHRATGCRRRVSLCSRSWRPGHLLSKVAVSPSRQLCARPSPRAEGPELGRAHDSSDPVTGTSGRPPQRTHRRAAGCADVRRRMRHPDDVHPPAGWLAALQHASWVMPSQLHDESPMRRCECRAPQARPLPWRAEDDDVAPAAVGCTAQPTASANCRCILIDLGRWTRPLLGRSRRGAVIGAWGGIGVIGVRSPARACSSWSGVRFGGSRRGPGISCRYEQADRPAVAGNQRYPSG